MDFKEYQGAAARTANMDVEAFVERIKQHPEYAPLSNFALGLAGEAGEVADEVKKVVYHGHPLDVEKIKKELGDVLWYWSSVANVLGLDTEAVAVANVAKLMARYPEGFSEADSKERRDTLPFTVTATPDLPDTREYIVDGFTIQQPLEPGKCTLCQGRRVVPVGIDGAKPCPVCGGYEQRLNMD